MTKRIFLLALLLGATVATMAQRYVGGDISLLPSYEAKGAEYYDEAGAPIDDPLAFFASKGMNAMRLRLFVQPAHASAEDKGQGVCQDLDYIVPLAKRVKQAGLRLLLDFHYSDSWADPAKQWTPRAWQGLDDETLADSLAQYTRRVLRRLKAEGATPDLIQTGNEISYGMLWGAESEGYAKACYPDAPKANWQRFARLLRRATEVCREECPEARIILHTERVSVSQQQDNAHYAALSYFVARAKEYQIDYDILGLSYYPYFHGALSELEGAIRLLESEASDKEVMVVETGYPYAWAVPGTTYDATSTWSYSAEGQRQFVDDLVTMLRRHEAVTGLFWWFMEANERGVSSSSVGTMPRFSTTARGAPRLPSVAWLPSSPPQPWIVWPPVLVPLAPPYGLLTASSWLANTPTGWSWLRAARSLSDRRGPSGEAPPVMLQGCVIFSCWVSC